MILKPQESLHLIRGRFVAAYCTIGWSNQLGFWGVNISIICDPPSLWIKVQHHQAYTTANCRYDHHDTTQQQPVRYFLQWTCRDLISSCTPKKKHTICSCWWRKPWWNSPLKFLLSIHVKNPSPNPLGNFGQTNLWQSQQSAEFHRFHFIPLDVHAKRALNFLPDGEKNRTGKTKLRTFENFLLNLVSHGRLSHHQSIPSKKQ